MNELKNILFNFEDEQLEWLVSAVTNTEKKAINKVALFKKIDENIEKFIQKVDAETFNKVRESFTEGQRRIFYYMVHITNKKIPNEFYKNNKEN